MQQKSTMVMHLKRCCDGSLVVAKEQSSRGFRSRAKGQDTTGARTMGVDSTTHTLYLLTAEFEPRETWKPPSPNEARNLYDRGCRAVHQEIASHINVCREVMVPLITAALALVTISHAGFSQKPSILGPSHAVDAVVHSLNIEETTLTTGNALDDVTSNDPDPAQPEPAGRVRRGAARLWRDQKELYTGCSSDSRKAGSL